LIETKISVIKILHNLIDQRVSLICIEIALFLNNKSVLYYENTLCFSQKLL
jgi:hypothetical protein